MSLKSVVRSFVVFMCIAVLACTDQATKAQERDRKGSLVAKVWGLKTAETPTEKALAAGTPEKIAEMNQELDRLTHESQRFVPVRGENLCAVYDFLPSVEGYLPRYSIEDGYDVTVVGARSPRYRTFKGFPKEQYWKLRQTVRDSLEDHVYKQLREKGYFESCTQGRLKGKTGVELFDTFTDTVADVRGYISGKYYEDLQDRISEREDFKLLQNAYVHSRKPMMENLVGRRNEEHNNGEIVKLMREAFKSWGVVPAELGVPDDKFLYFLAFGRTEDLN